jgi:hypothetical protein
MYSYVQPTYTFFLSFIHFVHLSLSALFPVLRSRDFYCHPPTSFLRLHYDRGLPNTEGWHRLGSSVRQYQEIYEGMIFRIFISITDVFRVQTPGCIFSYFWDVSRILNKILSTCFTKEGVWQLIRKLKVVVPLSCRGRTGSKIKHCCYHCKVLF